MFLLSAVFTMSYMYIFATKKYRSILLVNLAVIVHELLSLELDGVVCEMPQIFMCLCELFIYLPRI